MSSNFWKDFVIPSFVANLQILPETLLCGIIIFGILLASQPLIILAVCLSITQLLVHAMGTLTPGNATATSPLDACSTGFIGKSVARLFNNDPSLLWRPYAPSNYLATVGFITGWGYGLQLVYSDEIDKGIFPRPLMTTTAIVATILLILALVFRMYSSCESIIGAVTGTIIGLLFGYLGCVSLGYATNKKATNIWGIPLLRKKNDKSRG